MTTDISKKLRLPEDCGSILCAVSGGADSMCLLHLLRKWSEERGTRLYAAHYEHGIRGEESERDAAFVEEECRRLDIRLCTEHGDVPAFSREKGMGLEEAARTLRYDFLQRCADSLDCDYIATAHNADDNAETMLFNLCRGGGAKGLCGIPPRRGRLIRPLLSVTRAEIEDYMSTNSLAYVHDSTNDSDDYSRNLIRHRVMPVLHAVNGGCTEAMSRAAELMRQDEDLLEKLAADFIEENYREGSIDCKVLLQAHPAISSRVLRALCPKSLSMEHVKALMALAAGEGLGFCDVPGLRVTREQGRLTFGAERVEALPDMELTAGKTLELEAAKLRVRVEKGIYNGEIHGLFKIYWVKCESICGRLIIGSRRNGDKISPQGRNCTKSLKAIFTEKKMSQRQRQLCPVIRDDRGVLILAGHAVDRRCKPDIGDEALCIHLEKME